MDSKTLAINFIECFCQANLQGLEALLANDFRLSGPLFVFDSRQAYLDSLRGDLAADPEAHIRSVVAEGDEAAAFFTYQGNLIGQLFRCRDGKISETVLVFNSKQVKQ